MYKTASHVKLHGPGCDSFMYSCCRPPELGRKEKDIFEKRKQEFLEHEPECGVSRHRQFSKSCPGKFTSE